MARKILILILVIAAVFELALALGGFVVPETMLGAFNVSVTPETLFLGNVISWLLLAVTLVCAMALKWVLSGVRAGWELSLLLGFWWIGIGIGLYLTNGITQNLFLDSLKGLILAVAAWRTFPKSGANEKF